jgi:hypothetical protein
MSSISASVIALAIALFATVACSSDSSSEKTPPTDAGVDAGQMSPDCKRLYACCVGPASQTAAFCSNLVASQSCSAFLQAYAMANIQCN